MTDCPVCNNEVPERAPRCKHCFSDLAEHWQGGPSGSNPIWGVLLLGLVFLASGSAVYHQLSSQDQLGQVTVDPKEERIVLVYTSTRKEPETLQIEFSEVASIEMEANQNFLGGNQWLVYVVQTDGTRVLINRSREHALDSYASDIAHHTNKQLTIINNIQAGSQLRGT